MTPFGDGDPEDDPNRCVVQPSERTEVVRDVTRPWEARADSIAGERIRSRSIGRRRASRSGRAGRFGSHGHSAIGCDP
jgi:hypothetical protein